MPDKNGEILSCTHVTLLSKMIHVEIQMFMIEQTQNVSIDQLFHLGDIHQHARRGIDGSANGHFQDVIVSMTIGIITFTEDRSIRLVGERFRMKTMTGGKRFASRHVDFRHRI